MQLLPVFQNLQGYRFLAFVVEAPNNHTKGTFTKFLLDFIPIVNLLLWFIQIISLIIIKSMVVNSVLVGIWVRIFILAIDFSFDELASPFVLSIEIQIIYDIK